MDETYPEIKRRARKENAESYWGDETGVRNDCQHNRGDAPRGKTPIVEIDAKRFSINMISALSNQGLLRFMMYEETLTARVLLRFLKRLTDDAGRKVFLVLDNLRVVFGHMRMLQSKPERIVKYFSHPSIRYAA